MLPDEQCVCLRCLSLFPRAHAERHGNEVEYKLVGRFPLEHATTFCYYLRGNLYSQLIRHSKYSDRPWLNTQLARLFVQELRLAAQADGQSGWPYDVDVIVPIPVHLFRLLHRGYNQAEAIAEGLSSAWSIPVVNNCLYRRRYTKSQVGLSRHNRLQHPEGTFAVRHPDRLAFKHVLLVDDVLTSGATIVAAADALLQAAEGVRISVLTLSMTL